MVQNEGRNLSSIFDTIFNMEPTNIGSSSSIQELVRAMTMEVANETTENDSRHRMELNRKTNDAYAGINIREGVMDNMVAVLDPALFDHNREQRSIYQVLFIFFKKLFYRVVNKFSDTLNELFVVNWLI